MTAHDAKAVAQQLGEFDSTSDRITAEIRRLNRQKIVTLKLEGQMNLLRVVWEKFRGWVRW